MALYSILSALKWMFFSGESEAFYHCFAVKKTKASCLSLCDAVDTLFTILKMAQLLASAHTNVEALSIMSTLFLRLNHALLCW